MVFSSLQTHARRVAGCSPSLPAEGGDGWGEVGRLACWCVGLSAVGCPSPKPSPRSLYVFSVVELVALRRVAPRSAARRFHDPATSPRSFRPLNAGGFVAARRNPPLNTYGVRAPFPSFMNWPCGGLSAGKISLLCQPNCTSVRSCQESYDTAVGTSLDLQPGEEKPLSRRRPFRLRRCQTR